MDGEGVYKALEKCHLSAVEGEQFKSDDGKAVKDAELEDDIVASHKESESVMASIPVEVMEYKHVQEEACKIRSVKPVYLAAESLGVGDKNEVGIKMEACLKEAKDREVILVRALEELRLTLTRTQEEAVLKEDMFRRDIEDLQKQYQASRRQCEELISQVPDFNRPLLRQFEAMQETTAKRAETWAAVERSLKLNLQEAEAKAAAAEEKERYASERLTQTLARLNVMETQLASLRTEQTQLRRYLDKERQDSADHKLKCIALKRELDARRVRINQLDEEIRRLKRKHENELIEAKRHHERLQQELKQEMAPSPVSPSRSLLKVAAALENGSVFHPSSMSCVGESSFHRPISGSFDNRITTKLEENLESLHFIMTTKSSAAESSSISKMASIESIRDSLVEKLFKVTAQCEKLKAEASALPGIRAELEALKLKHSVALELIGERDEELEVLREDMVEMKKIYTKQLNQLMDKIRALASS